MQRRHNPLIFMLMIATISGGLMTNSTANGATFSCEFPETREAIALCDAVKIALSNVLGETLAQVDADAQYVLVVEQAGPTRVIAALNTFDKEGPRLGVTAVDRQEMPLDAINTLAGNLVSSLR